jgi:hypothetical protein
MPKYVASFEPLGPRSSVETLAAKPDRHRQTHAMFEGDQYWEPTR